MAWLTGWIYRKSHSITGSAGAGTNYQISITVHYGAGTDGAPNAYDVYCNSKCATDFADIRFTDNDGSTTLDYWIESKTDSDNAVIWIEVADDLGSNQTIYVYYGNAAASTASNIKTAFVIGDDFNDASLDTSLWDDIGGTNTEAAGVMKVEMSGGVPGHLRSDSTYAIGLEIMIYCKHASGDPLFGFAINGVTDISDSGWIQNVSGTWRCHAENEGAVTDSDVGVSDANYHKWTLQWYSGHVKSTLDGAGTHDVTTNVPDENMKVWFYAQIANGNYIEIDWIAVRKFIASEPTHGSWGSKETAPTLYTLINEMNY